MNKLLLIASVILFALFQSCEKDHYYRINRKDWTKLSKGDTIIFNASSSKDTFVVSIGMTYYDSDKIYHYEYLNIFYSPTNKKALNSDYYTIRNYRATQIEWNKQSNGFLSDTTLSLYNVVIKNVFCFSNDKLYGDTLPLDNKKVFYSNKYGVIQYELYNGQTFVMDSSILMKYMKKQ